MPSNTPHTSPLPSFSKGAHLRIESIVLVSDEAQRLRDLGLREGAQLSIVHNNDKLIVRVSGSRIGLRRELAMHVLATECPA